MGGVARQRIRVAIATPIILRMTGRTQISRIQRRGSRSAGAQRRDLIRNEGGGDEVRGSRTRGHGRLSARVRRTRPRPDSKPTISHDRSTERVGIVQTVLGQSPIRLIVEGRDGRQEAPALHPPAVDDPTGEPPNTETDAGRVGGHRGKAGHSCNARARPASTQHPGAVIDDVSAVLNLDRQSTREQVSAGSEGSTKIRNEGGIFRIPGVEDGNARETSESGPVRLDSVEQSHNERVTIMKGFHLQLEAYEICGQIAIVIKSREIPETLGEQMGPISVVSTAVQGPEDADRRAWLQDALIAALEAL